MIFIGLLDLYMSGCLMFWDWVRGDRIENQEVIEYVYIDYRVAIDLSVVGNLLCTSSCSYDTVT